MDCLKIIVKITYSSQLKKILYIRKVFIFFILKLGLLLTFCFSAFADESLISMIISDRWSKQQKWCPNKSQACHSGEGRNPLMHSFSIDNIFYGILEYVFLLQVVDCIHYNTQVASLLVPVFAYIPGDNLFFFSVGTSLVRK